MEKATDGAWTATQAIPPGGFARISSVESFDSHHLWDTSRANCGHLEHILVECKSAELHFPCKLVDISLPLFWANASQTSREGKDILFS